MRPGGQEAWKPAALRARPEALRLIGADITCSLVYGTQSVLLLVVSGQVGLGTHGYGCLFAAIGAGGLLGTALAGRASRSAHPRWILAAALAAVGLPMSLRRTRPPGPAQAAQPAVAAKMPGR